MLKEVLKKKDFSENTIILHTCILFLAKAATIDVFNHWCLQFTRSFPPDCQENSLPSSLKSLVSLVLNGPNLKDQDKCESQAFLTISQVILFNIKKSLLILLLKLDHELLPLQWLSMVWIYRDEQLNGSIQGKFQSPPLIILYLLWQSLYSGNGQMYMASQCMLLWWVACI